ncbi:cytochrome P450 [Phaeosphaeriaceae sp. PMI808]|nr:cytochrome P450 [Phaeosphaeriaceae sp. PMI808]
MQMVVVYAYRILLHPLKDYPGPFLAKFTDIYGAFFAWKRELHRVTFEDHKKYGPVIRQGPNKLVFNSANAIYAIYQNERILKSEAYLVTQIAPKIFNLFNVVDRDLHRTKRRIVGQGLSDRATRQFEPVMMGQIDTFLRLLLKSHQDGKPREMSEACKLLGFDISVELGFGYNLKLQSGAENRWMVEAMSTSNWRINLYIQWPSLKKLNLEKVFLPILLPKVLRYHRLVKKMVTSRRAEEKHARPDLFSFISDYKDPESGQKLSSRELWSESTFLIPAGGDTTGTTMAAVFFYLSRYPECYQKLAQEIRSTFDSGTDIRAGPQLSGCKYLRACVDETLRISPPVGTTLWRDIPKDGQGPVLIDRKAIPEGTRIGVNLYSIHHNEEFFPEPWVFRPERFLDESSKQSSIERKAFSPFSVGYRSCAGKPLAYLESSVTIAKALWYFDFAPARNEHVALKVFHMLDQQGSEHYGPLLDFKPRNGVTADYESR